MSLSLYAATIPSFQQILGSVAGLIDKAEAFCTERGIAPEKIIAARLADDMLPFAYQIKSVAVHSIGAVGGLRNGRFAPDTSTPPDSFAALQRRIAETRAAIDLLEPREIDGYAGKTVIFAPPGITRTFTGTNFLLSFSLPNFYFHAATAYAILRKEGVPIGKRDFLGRIRIEE